MTTESAATSATTTNDGGTSEVVATTTEATAAAPAVVEALGDKIETVEVKEETAPVVPEVYELKMPEGMDLDKDAASEFSTLAKELKLDQATAQKFADIGAAMATRQAEAHAAQVQSWVDSVKSDKEIGGDKLAENLGIARKAFEQFGNQSARDIITNSGLGNHPDLIKMFIGIGKAMSDDGFVRGAAPGTSESVADKMYPSMKKS
jgi:hypothetical protein